MSASAPTIFVRLLRDEDKGAALAASVTNLQNGTPDGRTFVVPTESLRQVPGTPFAYWVSGRIRRLYSALPPFEGSGRAVRVGLQTGDDFRFLRAWWEVNPDHMLDAECGPDWQTDTVASRRWCLDRTYDGKQWVPFAKGGQFSPYHADVALVVNWLNDGREVRAFAGSVPRNRQHYFSAGLTYLSRTSLRLCSTPLPPGTIFSHVGPAIFPRRGEFDISLARFNSYTAEATIAPFHARGTEGDDQTKKYEVGLLQLVPWPSDANPCEGEAANVAMTAFQERASLDETGRSFYAPIFGGDPTDSIVDAILCVERAVADAYGLTLEDSFATACSEVPTLENIRADIKNGVRVGLNWPDRRQQTLAILSYCFGCAFGRWDIRLALEERRVALHADSFAPTPVRPPGMLREADSLALRSISTEYPLRVRGDGILVDDPGHAADVIRNVHEAVSLLYGEQGEEAIRKLIEITPTVGSTDGGLRPWLRDCCFDCHRKRYTRSGRKAPIYWQLATPSASYSTWLYYHRFTSDTFYKVLNEYVKPKVDHEQRKLDRLRAEAGPESTRSQCGEVEQQEKFVAELKTFTEEIERIAPLWNPDLNDGVIINFAPLWRLVPQHRAWQKECKACWDKLVAGDYDWAHLAMHLWPERVVPKCRTDASLAIAHGLEDVFWELNEKGKWVTKEKPDGGWDAVVERLVVERTSSAVKAALESLLNAPAPSSGRKTRKTGKRRKKGR